MPSSRIAELSANPMVQAYAQGIAQTSILPAADFFAPTVPVPTLRGRYKKYDQKSRFRIPDTKRAPGAKAVRIEWSLADAQYDATPNAIDIPIDNLEDVEAESAGISMMQDATVMARDIATLSHENRVIQLALDNVTATGGVGGWLDADGKPSAGDPVAEIDAQLEAVVTAAPGGAPAILWGSTAWRHFKNHSQVRNKFVVGSGRGSVGYAIPRLEIASGLFLYEPEMMISRMVKDTAVEGQDRVLSLLAPTDIWVFVRNPSPTRYDPSFMKTFRLANQWMVPGAYPSEDQRGQVAKFDWSADVQITNSEAVKRITVGAAV